MGDPRALARGIGPIGLWSSSLLSLPTDELGRAAAELEDLGFGALWLPESTWADPFVGAALVLSATGSLRVATGVARIHGRAAPVMSNAWRALSSWFPGRFVLGVGVSHRPVAERLGASYDKPLAAMRHYLERLDSARFDGPPVGSGGAGTHLVLAALGSKMLALAAERTDGAHPYTSTAVHTTGARSTLGPEPLLAPEVKVVFEEDPSVARTIARRWLPLRLPNYANNLVRSGFDPEAVTQVADEVVDALVGWGDDDAIRAHLQAHLDAGADHVAVQVLTAEPDPAPRDAWLRLSRMFR